VLRQHSGVARGDQFVAVGTAADSPAKGLTVGLFGTGLTDTRLTFSRHIEKAAFTCRFFVPEIRRIR
jgi:hypothetical protein